MTIQTHLTSLRDKHTILDKAIQEETHRPIPDSKRLQDLKRQKLAIKEKIEGLRKS